MDLMFIIVVLCIFGIMIYGYSTMKEENTRRGH